MLTFNPTKRITVNSALDHSLFTDIRTKDKEIDWAGSPIKLDFEEEEDLDEPLLRKYFWKELQVYNPTS